MNSSYTKVFILAQFVEFTPWSFIVSNPIWIVAALFLNSLPVTAFVIFQVATQLLLALAD